MKIFASTVLALTVIAPTVCRGQATPSFDATQSQRAQIAALRQQAADHYAQALKACAAAFAVNDCSRQAKEQHRQVMDDLRRQEISLNDVQRRAKAATQLERNEGRLLEQDDRDASQRGKPGQGTDPAARRQAEKQQTAEQQAEQVNERSRTIAEHQRNLATAAAKQSAKAAQAAAKEKAYADRMEAARLHKAELEARQKKKAGSMVAPLPDPP